MVNCMGALNFSIEFLPVESGQKSGDAIAIKYGSEGQNFYHVVDGGTTEASEALINHIKTHYGTTYIDNVVCTHTDSDHSSGLRNIIQTFDVGTIWMNRPWLYAAEIKHTFKGNWTTEGLRRALRDAYPITAEIEDIALERGIPIKEAFQGSWIGPFLVTSPSRQFYLSLIPHFSKTPEPTVSRSNGSGVVDKIKEAIGEAVNFVAETFHSEYLPGGETSASNESSIVQYVKLDGKIALLTGDAGTEALRETIDFLNYHKLPTKQFDLIQVPHHGSRRNVSTEILNELIGPPLTFLAQNKTAIVSSSKKDEDHPRKRVVNAFIRRGYGVSVTEGKTFCYGDFEGRIGWGPAPILPFYELVEDVA